MLAKLWFAYHKEGRPPICSEKYWHDSSLDSFVKTLKIYNKLNVPHQSDFKHIADKQKTSSLYLDA